jgi:large subunit ribosomal protein L24
MKIRTGDKVKIIAGKDKGKVSKVLRVFKEKDKVLVEGVNMVKKHIKPGKGVEKGGIANIEKPIHVSNVMCFDEKANQAVRIGYKIIDGKKYRISRKSGDVI